MPEPLLKKFPAEIFGYPYTNTNDEIQNIRQRQYCPFLDAECKKPRKSEPHIKVGICSVGYRVSPDKEHEPVIICPHRFDLEAIFNAVLENEFHTTPNDETVIWASEVSIGTAGSVDFVAAKTEIVDDSYDIQDFVCVELQAAGTTGTPWKAFLEHQKHGKFLEESYNYGINWANEFAKTMMQQAYKKGTVVEHWGKRVIFVIQDVGLEYLAHSYDTSDLREAQPSDPVHFYTFKMFWNEEKSGWDLRLDERLSTDTEGIRKILAGQNKEKFLTVPEFKENILRKII